MPIFLRNEPFRRTWGPMPHRPELDGIRAIAVMAVLLFHADETSLGGGYVGVDVFFALSGYLITGIISHKISEGTFSFTDFYARRIRRLIPAMLPVVIFSSALAGALFLSDRLRSFTASLLGVFTYSSNFVFLSEADYFDEASATKPLLHTWSLAVEEQFYLFFPALLFLLMRGGNIKRAKIATGAMAVGSLVMAIVAMRAGSVDEAFYVSPLRFWEMLLGSLLALSGFEFKVQSRALLSRLLGLVLVSVPMVSYTTKTSFPGLAALPPVLGTLLVIAGGAQQSDGLIRALSHPVMVYVGKISYGLYLWHWPILVAARLLWPTVQWAPYLGLLCSLGVSALSYHFWEAPLRFGRVLGGRRRPYVFLGASSFVVLLATAYSWHRLNSMPSDMGFYFDWKRTKEEWNFDCKTPLKNISQISCADAGPTRPTLMLIGDSQAQHLLPGIKSRWPDVNLAVLAAGGCKPIRGYRQDRPDCRELRDELFRKFDGWKYVDLVILSVRQNKDTVRGVAATAKWIANKGVPVWLISGYLEHKPSLSELVAQHPQIDPGELDRLAQKARDDRSFSIANEVQRTTPPGVRFVDGRRIFCSYGHCVTFVDHGTTRAPINANSFHLSTAGSEWFVSQLPPVDFDTRVDGVEQTPRRRTIEKPTSPMEGP